jgi:hypothetical protein
MIRDPGGVAAVSIEVFGVILDSGLPEQFDQFLAVGLQAMMFLLMGNVALNRYPSRGAYRERGIALLPGERRYKVL